MFVVLLPTICNSYNIQYVPFRDPIHHCYFNVVLKLGCKVIKLLIYLICWLYLNILVINFSPNYYLTSANLIKNFSKQFLGNEDVL